MYWAAGCSTKIPQKKKVRGKFSIEQIVRACAKEQRMPMLMLDRVQHWKSSDESGVVLVVGVATEAAKFAQEKTPVTRSELFVWRVLLKGCCGANCLVPTNIP